MCELLQTGPGARKPVAAVIIVVVIVGIIVISWQSVGRRCGRGQGLGGGGLWDRGSSCQVALGATPQASWTGEQGPRMISVQEKHRDGWAAGDTWLLSTHSVPPGAPGPGREGRQSGQHRDRQL